MRKWLTRRNVIMGASALAVLIFVGAVGYWAYFNLRYKVVQLKGVPVRYDTWTNEYVIISKSAEENTNWFNRLDWLFSTPKEMSPAEIKQAAPAPAPAPLPSRGVESRIRPSGSFIMDYHERGVDLAKAGDHEQAIIYYNQAIQSGQGSSRVYTDRGFSLSRQSRHNEAIADFRTAILLDKTNATAFAMMGDGLIAVGKIAEGCSALNRACGMGYCEQLRNYQSYGFCKN